MPRGKNCKAIPISNSILPHMLSKAPDKKRLKIYEYSQL